MQIVEDLSGVKFPNTNKINPLSEGAQIRMLLPPSCTQSELQIQLR